MFTLKIKTDNDAFVDSPSTELARLLREVADDIEAGTMSAKLVDRNGNIVGEFKGAR